MPPVRKKAKIDNNEKVEKGKDKEKNKEKNEKDDNLSKSKNKIIEMKMKHYRIYANHWNKFSSLQLPIICLKNKNYGGGDKKIPYPIFQAPKENLGNCTSMNDFDELNRISNDPSLIQWQFKKLKERFKLQNKSDTSLAIDKSVITTTKKKLTKKILFDWRYVLSPFYETIVPIVYQGRQYATEAHAICAQKFDDDEWQKKFCLSHPSCAFFPHEINKGHQVDIVYKLCTASGMYKTSKSITTIYRPKYCTLNPNVLLENDSANHYESNHNRIPDNNDDLFDYKLDTDTIINDDKVDPNSCNRYHSTHNSKFVCPEVASKTQLPCQSNDIIQKILYAKYMCDPLAKRILLATGQALLYNESLNDHNDITQCIPLLHDLMSVREQLRAERDDPFYFLK